MKKYKFSIIIIFIFFFTYILYLYHNNRIIILWEKNHFIKNNITYLFKNDYYGMWIDFITGKEKKIPCSIDQSANESVLNKEDLLYIFLHKFFYYINIDHIGIFQYNFNHIVLYERIGVINGALFINKNFSPEQEYYFLKSIYLTVKIFFPDIKELYFYDEDTLLPLQYIMPFFNENMLSKGFLDSTQEDCRKYSPYIIPYIQDMGNKIFSIFEKNIFQINSHKNIFKPKSKNKFDYSIEINKHNVNDYDKIIFYINFISGIEDSISIYYYPFLNKNEHVCDKVLFPSIIKNNDFYVEVLNKIQKKIPAINIFIDTVYPSFYIVCKVSSEIKAKEYINLLTTIL